MANHIVAVTADGHYGFRHALLREEGLSADAPTKLTVPYDVAKAVFVEGNQQAAMQAFMQGQVKVEGDMSKLMAMQTAAPTPEQTALQEKVKAITE